MMKLFVVLVVVGLKARSGRAMPQFIASDPASALAWGALEVANSWGVPMRTIVTFDEELVRLDEDPLETLTALDEDGSVGVEALDLANLGMTVLNFPFDAKFSEMRDYLDAVLELEFVVSVEADSVVGIPSNEELSSVFQSNETTSAPNEVSPNDRLYDQLWGHKRMRLPEAWTRTTALGEAYRPIVAVIDTGVDYTHPDLADNMWVNEAEAYGLPGVDDDGNGYIDDIHGWNAITGTGDPFDDHWHGTHCAGIIGAVANNTQGIVGVNWAPLIQGCKFLDANGRGTTSNALACVDYTISTGASISNNSWGSYSRSVALQAAIARSAAAGQLFVAAAGNSGEDTDIIPFYPAGFDLPNLIAVAALDDQGVIASYSNYGATSVDVAAPGSGIVSTYPNNNYAFASGTSMAAPYVSGLASLALAVNPQLTAEDLINKMRQSVATFGQKELLNWGGECDAVAFVDSANASLTDNDEQPPIRTVLAASTASCLESCALTGLSCDEDATTLFNTDLDACFDAIEESGVSGYWSKGSVDFEESTHPTGCFATFRWRTHILNINTNTFGTGILGCAAPSAEVAYSYRVCACV